MAKVDLCSQEWCNMVFEGKNQAYGAYKMRKTSAKRHNLAMLWLIIIALLAFALPTLIQMAKPKQKDVNTMVTQLSTLDKPKVKQKEFKKIEMEKPKEQLVKSSIKFTAPVIKKDSEVKEQDEMKSQKELTESKVTISIADVKGNDEKNGKDIADLKKIVTQEAPKEDDDDNKVFDMVEVQPSFPGGTNEMMSWISGHLKYPAIAAENGIEGKVIVQFVVGKNGAIRDANIVRALNPSCDKEALRVVNAMPRWLPGKQNGKEVSVKFTLPITFKLQ
ncbi:MAG: energy transducer TonB [Bacteroidales bacterium]|nr:energy transducer TonB [Bacteroidales bacterium]